MRCGVVFWWGKILPNPDWQTESGDMCCIKAHYNPTMTQWRRHRREEVFSPCATASVPAEKQQSEMLPLMDQVFILILKKNTNKNTKTRSKSLTYFPVNLKKVSNTFLSTSTYHTPSPKMLLQLLQVHLVFTNLKKLLKYFCSTVYTGIYQALKSIQAEKKYIANLCTNQ